VISSRCQLSIPACEVLAIYVKLLRRDRQTNRKKTDAGYYITSLAEVTRERAKSIVVSGTCIYVVV